MIKVIWFTGLSGAGKSTLALALKKVLQEEYALSVIVLDGDDLRSGLNRDLGFTEGDRIENIRRIAEVAKLFHQNGFVPIVATISPYRHLRQLAREVIGADRFLEIYLDASLQTCETRDVKGLYKRARNKEMPHFTGISDLYEAPAGGLRVNTGTCSQEESLFELMELLQSHLTV